MHIKVWKGVLGANIVLLISLGSVSPSYLNNASDVAKYVGYARSVYPFVFLASWVLFGFDLSRANSLKADLRRYVPNYLLDPFENIPLTFFLGIKPEELEDFREVVAVSSEPDLIKNYFGLHKYLGV